MITLATKKMKRRFYQNNQYYFLINSNCGGGVIVDGSRIGTIQNGSFNFSSKKKNVLVKIEGGVPSSKSEVISSRTEGYDYEIDAKETFESKKTNNGAVYSGNWFSFSISIFEKTTSKETYPGPPLHDMYIKYKEITYNTVRDTTYAAPSEMQVVGSSMNKNNPMEVRMDYSSTYTDRDTNSGYSTKQKKSRANF